MTGSKVFTPEPEKPPEVTGKMSSRESTRGLGKEVKSPMTDQFVHEPHPTIEEIQPFFAVDTQETGRTYKIRDRKYESITTVLGRSKKDAIDQWRKRVGEEVADRISGQATTNGSRVHDLAEQLLRNQPVSSSEIRNESPIIITSYRALEKVLRSKVTTVHALESALYSDYLGVAGRVDCVGVFDDRLSVIDFKTSRSEKKREHIHTYFMQEAAYAIMWEELTGTPIHQLVTIMAVNGNLSAEVFVEKRKNWEQPLLRTLRENMKPSLDFFLQD